MRLWPLVLVAICLVAASPVAGGVEDPMAPDGAPFAIAASVGQAIDEPIVAAWWDGEFLVGWSDGRLQVQRFSTDRQPLGPAVELGGVEGQSCGTAALEPDLVEGFWAAWCELIDGRARSRIRRFERDGTPVTPVIDIAPAESGWATVAAQLAWVVPGVVVVWLEVDLEGPDFDLPRLRSQHYDRDGQATGVAQDVSILPPSAPSRPDIVLANWNSLIVTWTGYEAETESTGPQTPVRARFLDATGTPSGPVITVAEVDVNPLSNPRVAVFGNQDESFVVAWSGSVARYRLFDAAGKALGPTTDLGGGCLRVEYADLVVASSRGVGAIVGCNTDGSLLKQAFVTAGGATDPVEIAQTSGYRASATLVDNARVVAAWTIEESPIVELGISSIEAQRFKYVPIFHDDFEDGSTAAWGQVVP